MTAFEVIGIGNAIIDVIASIEDDDLQSLEVEKGIMQLVERERSEFLLAQQARRGKARLVPGGSVANTLAGIGRLGLKTAFIGRVADDELGQAYARDTEAEGTSFVNAPVAGGKLPTSRSPISGGGRRHGPRTAARRSARRTSPSTGGWRGARASAAIVSSSAARS